MEFKIPFKQACMWIILSVIVITGGCALAIVYYHHILKTHANNDAYHIVAIVQTSPDQELLQTVYLAELLDLSVDRPTNLYQFNIAEARNKLLMSPLIKEATVRRIKPGTVYVDYLSRQPVAFLLDYTNTAVDKEGFLLPFKPFFTPKRLPEIYLGLSNESLWGKSINNDQSKLAFAFVSYLNRHYCSENRRLKRVDVSRALEPSLGGREIVVIIEEQSERVQQGKSVLCVCNWILRISPDLDYRQALANYAVLRDHLMVKQQPIEDLSSIHYTTITLDLRLPQIAFIDRS